MSRARSSRFGSLTCGTSGKIGASWVKGPVRSDQLQVVLRGSREVFEACRPTGRWTTDVLVFTYSHRC